MNVAGVVVLYNPKANELVQNISSYGNRIEKLFCIDNSDSGLINPESLSSLDIEIQYISMNGNEGLAKALKTGCDRALEEGFGYVLLMDQDSIFENGAVERLINAARENPGYALFAPTIKNIYRDEESIRRLSSEIYYGIQDSLNQEIGYAITSGSLVNLTVYRETEGFDENLFIGQIDNDYCCRLKARGYKMLGVGSALMYQEPGRMQIRRIFGRDLHIPNLPPMRYYYIFRNERYLRKKNGRMYKEYKVNLLKYFVSVMIFEKNLCSFIIPLLPLLSMYKSPLPNIELGSFLCIFLFVWHIVSGRTFRIWKREHLWMWYVVYIIMTSLINDGVRVLANFSFIKQIFYVQIIILFVYDCRLFDYQKAVVWYKRITIFSTTYIYIQSLLFYGFNYGLPGYFPHLIYTESYANRLKNLTGQGFFRPTSIFYEPTHYANYVCIAVLLFLFYNNEKHWLRKAMFVTGGVLLSGSSIGIAAALCIWLAWIYKAVVSRRRGWISVAFFVLVIGAMLLPLFFRMDIGEKIIARTFGDGGVAMGGNATSVRLAAYSLLGTLSPVQRIIGTGYNNVLITNDIYYYASWAYNLICIGLIGTVIVALIYIKAYRCAVDFATRVLILYFTVICVLGFFFSSYEMVFYFSFIIPMTREWNTYEENGTSELIAYNPSSSPCI